MYKYIVLILSILATPGCETAVKRDGYTPHIASSNTHKVLSEKPEFYLEIDNPIDIRGEFINDDSIGGTNTLYAGDFGLAAVVLQIGAHAAASSSMRNKKLLDAQLEANKVLAPISTLLENLNHNSLLDDKARDFIVSADRIEDKPQVLTLPIFYVAPDFEYISVRNKVWIPVKNNYTEREKADQFLYQNIIEVISTRFTREERNALKTNGKSNPLKNELVRLFNESLRIATRDLQGKYEKTATMTSFKVEKENKSRYIRGYVVDDLCHKQVVRNLRSWLIAIPSSNSNGKTSCQDQSDAVSSQYRYKNALNYAHLPEKT